MSDSSEEYEVYHPEGDLTVESEVNNDTYSYLEYITLEYPSQTVIEHNNNILVSQGGKNPSLVELKFKNLKKNAKFESRKFSVSEEINRLRSNSDVVIGVSDHKAYFFSKNFKVEAELENHFSYGVALTGTCAFLGTQKGEVLRTCFEAKNQEVLKIHTDGINGLCFVNDLLFSASDDNTLKITDTRSKDAVFTHKCDSNVNSVDAKTNSFVFGDDAGTVYVSDMRNRENLEQIKWHKSPISSVMFRDEDVFCTLSDEQACLCDKTLEGEWEYHKFLYFVHQGQKYYKECAFIDDYVITTSQDGVAIFKPVEE